jgi:hypothetical protein
VADSVRKIWPCSVRIFSPCLLPPWTLPTGINIRTAAWRNGPGEVMMCTPSHGGQSQAKCWRILHRRAGQARGSVCCYTYLSLSSFLPPSYLLKLQSELLGTSDLCWPSSLALSKWGAGDSRLCHWLSSGVGVGGMGGGSWRRGWGCEVKLTSLGWNMLAVPAGRIKVIQKYSSLLI